MLPSRYILRFRKGGHPLLQGAQNFQWLNELSLAELLSDLQHGHKPESLRVSGSLPSGFAEYHRPWFSRSSVVQGANQRLLCFVFVGFVKILCGPQILDRGLDATGDRVRLQIL